MNLNRCGRPPASSWSWTQALMLSCTTLPRNQHNWPHSHRTIRLQRNFPCIPDRSSTHLGLEPEAPEPGSPRVLVPEASAKSRRTSSQHKPSNWIRSRRTTRPKSRGQRTPLLDQCSTGAVPGLVLAEELAVRESALESAVRESALELAVPGWVESKQPQRVLILRLQSKKF